MRDLTERLRSGFGGLVPPVCDEAANVIEALRAELSDALARVGELTTVLKWIDESFNGRHRSPFEHMLEVAHKAQGALTLPTLGAASRLRDEVLEEAANIGYDEVLKATESITAALRVHGAIRARKSKETGR